ncbi:hypothetical protein U2F10_05505 [Leptothoe sp. EHU-05/26/07-4]
MSDSGPRLERGDKYSTGHNTSKYELIFKGKTIDPESGYIEVTSFPSKTYNRLVIKNLDLYEEITIYSPRRLQEYEIIFNRDWYLNDVFKNFYIDNIRLHTNHYFHQLGDVEGLSIEFHFAINILSWQNNWTLENQLNSFKEFISESFSEYEIGDIGTTSSISEPGNITPVAQYNLYILYPDLDFPLNKFINRCLKTFSEAQKKIIEKYQSSLTTYSLSKHFDFSEFSPGIRSACERYLTYFADFLRDVGIEASVNIDKKGKDLYFSVIPESEEDELETINILLEQFYIRLPDSDLIKKYKSSSELDFASERLVRQVRILEDEIRLINLERKTKALELYQKEDEIEELALTKDNLTDALLDQQSEIKSLIKEVEEKSQRLIASEVLNSSLKNKLTVLESDKPDKETILRYFAVENFKAGDIKKLNFLEIRAALMARDINAAPKRLFQVIQAIRTWVKSRKS